MRPPRLLLEISEAKPAEDTTLNFSVTLQRLIINKVEWILNYDVIVIGAGHAGCEAAAAAANLGSKTCLITMDMNKIGQMSYNLAVGGIAKGQIVREIDALGGQMGLVTDETAIQFRILNRSKGPAMWSPCAQCDRAKFIWSWREKLENTPTFISGRIPSVNCSLKTVK